jgi:ribonuclease D
VNSQYIEEPEQLARFCQHLRECDLIAFDTEFVAEDSYKPDLCLIQVATTTQCGIIDPYSCGPLSDFWSIIIDPSKTIVVHSGREESLFCYRATGKIIPGLFDTQLAAGLLGFEYPISYANLNNRLLGKLLDKEETRSDWRRRPLTSQQLSYAAQDVRDLPEICSILGEKLRSQDRLSWLREESLQRQNALAAFETDEQWHRMAGIQSLHGQSLAIAVGLWRWRQGESARRDMPPRRVLRDDLIVELAKRKSADAKRIVGLRGMETRYLRNQVDVLSEVIASAMHDEVPQWPPKQRAIRSQPSPMLIQYLNAAMSCLCRRKHIAPSIVGTSDDLKELVSHKLTSHRGNDDPLPSLMRGWRSQIIGQTFDDLLSGKISLQIHNPNSEMPLRLSDIK